MSSDEESEIDNANEIIQEEPYVKPKRKMSPEHLAKLAEGRVKSLEIRSKKGNELKKIKQEKIRIKEAKEAAKEAEEVARAAALLSIDESASGSKGSHIEEEPVKIKKKKKKPTVIFESDESDDDNDRVIYVRRREKKVTPAPPPPTQRQPPPPPPQPPPPPPPPPPRSYLPKRPAYVNHFANY